MRIAMALYGDISYDSRVLREASSLSGAGYEVTVYCLSGSPPADVPFEVVAHAPCQTSVLPGRDSQVHAEGDMSSMRRAWTKATWVVGYLRNLRAWGSWVVSHAGDVDVWHAHDLPGLMAVGPHKSEGWSLVYDSHEIFVDAGSALRLPRLMRRLLRWYESRLASRAVVLITVNEGYADVLNRRLRPRHTIIVRNCPPRWDPPARLTSPLRKEIGVAENTSVLLYHGVLGSSRGTEQMARSLLCEGMEAAHGVALGFGDRAVLDEWAAEPRFGGRLHVLEAVPPSELLAWVAGADVDVIALQHTTLNHYLCSPNKLWESLAAGVPVVVSDFPVMRNVVLGEPDGPLGAVCDPSDPESIASAVRQLVDLPPEDRTAIRERCLQAAHTRWNWESESARLVSLYDGLRDGPARSVETPS